jgi:hypothetical protein
LAMAMVWDSANAVIRSDKKLVTSSVDCMIEIFSRQN